MLAPLLLEVLLFGICTPQHSLTLLAITLGCAFVMGGTESSQRELEETRTSRGLSVSRRYSSQSRTEVCDITVERMIYDHISSSLSMMIITLGRGSKAVALYRCTRENYPSGFLRYRNSSDEHFM
jgi:hypothetical protein